MSGSSGAPADGTSHRGERRQEVDWWVGKGKGEKLPEEVEVEVESKKHVGSFQQELDEEQMLGEVTSPRVGGDDEELGTSTEHQDQEDSCEQGQGADTSSDDMEGWDDDEEAWDEAEADADEDAGNNCELDHRSAAGEGWDHDHPAEEQLHEEEDEDFRDLESFDLHQVLGNLPRNPNIARVQAGFHEKSTLAWGSLDLHSYGDLHDEAGAAGGAGAAGVERCWERFKQIVLAFLVLRDPVRRQIYEDLGFEALKRSESYAEQTVFGLKPVAEFERFFRGEREEDRDYLLMNSSEHFDHGNGEAMRENPNTIEVSGTTSWNNRGKDEQEQNAKAGMLAESKLGLSSPGGADEAASSENGREVETRKPLTASLKVHRLFEDEEDVAPGAAQTQDVSGEDLWSGEEEDDEDMLGAAFGGREPGHNAEVEMPRNMEELSTKLDQEYAELLAQLGAKAGLTRIGDSSSCLLRPSGGAPSPKAAELSYKGDAVASGLDKAKANKPDMAFLPVGESSLNVKLPPLPALVCPENMAEQVRKDKQAFWARRFKAQRGNGSGDKTDEDGGATSSCESDSSDGENAEIVRKFNEQREQKMKEIAKASLAPTPSTRKNQGRATSTKKNSIRNHPGPLGLRKQGRPKERMGNKVPLQQQEDDDEEANATNRRLSHHCRKQTKTLLALARITLPSATTIGSVARRHFRLATMAPLSGSRTRMKKTTGRGARVNLKQKNDRPNHVVGSSKSCRKQHQRSCK